MYIFIYSITLHIISEPELSSLTPFKEAIFKRRDKARCVISMFVWQISHLHVIKHSCVDSHGVTLVKLSLAKRLQISYVFF